jgi:hypothetical protein
MSYRLSLTVPHYKLTSVLASLPRGLKFEVERLGDEEDERPEPEGRRTTIISLGPKPPTPGTLADKISSLLMALEVKHGAHKVTRALLNEAMKKAKFTEGQISSALTTAISNGHFKQERQ